MQTSRGIKAQQDLAYPVSLQLDSALILALVQNEKRWLCGVVALTMQLSAFSGALFVFCNRQRVNGH